MGNPNPALLDDNSELVVWVFAKDKGIYRCLPPGTWDLDHEFGWFFIQFGVPSRISHHVFSSDVSVGTGASVIVQCFLPGNRHFIKSQSEIHRIRHGAVPSARGRTAPVGAEPVRP